MKMFMLVVKTEIIDAASMIYGNSVAISKKDTLLRKMQQFVFLRGITLVAKPARYSLVILGLASMKTLNDSFLV